MHKVKEIVRKGGRQSEEQDLIALGNGTGMGDACKELKGVGRHGRKEGMGKERLYRKGIRRGRESNEGREWK